MSPWLTGIAVGIFGVWLISGALERRGRWDLNEPIAAADRLFTAAPLYSAGNVDGFLPSTPYFPGVTLVAYEAKRLVGADLQEEALLVVACLLVLIYFLLLVRVFRQIGGRSEPAVAFLATMLAAYLGYRVWVSYAAEFKPDTAALVMATAGFIIAFGGRATFLRTAALFVSCAVSLAFKQQAAALLVGLFASIVLSPLPKGDKLRYASAVIAAAVIGSLSLLTIRNLQFFAIEAHMGRQRLGFAEFFGLQRLIGVELLAPILLLWTGARNRPRAAHRLGAQLLAPSALRSYVVMCIPWLLIEIQSSAIVGGNAGNTATGLIPFSPVVIIAFERLFGRRVLEPAVALLSIGAAIVMLRPSLRQLSGVSAYYRDRSAAIAELAPFKGARAFISGSSYVVARRAGIRSVSELETAGHIDGGKFRGTSLPRLNERLKRQEYDLILCIPDCGGLVADPAFSIAPWYTPSNRFRSPLLRESVLLRSRARL